MYPSQLPTGSPYDAIKSTISTASAVSIPSTSLLSSTLSTSSSLLSTTPISSLSIVTTSTASASGISTALPLKTPTTRPSLTASSYSTVTMGLSSSASSTALASGTGMLMQKPGDCELLGSFALFVQLALGALAMLSLVWKRYRERPQRPVKIWFFDVSKQVFGSALVHVANVFMAMLTSGRFDIKVDPGNVYNTRSLLRRNDDDSYQPNPCSWYLLNLAVDTTLGIPILIILLRIYTALAARTPLGRPRESIQSGNYGSPPKALWWFKQSMIYFCGLFGMKVVVLIIFVAFPWIAHIGDWALQWTEGNEQLQIIFVMMLFPLIMNAMQYYIIDSFIKKQDDAGRAGYDSDSRGRHSLVSDSDDPLLHRVDDSSDEDHGLGLDSDSDSDLDLAKSATNEDEDVHRYRNHLAKDGEYDPTIDGDAPTLLGSSSGRSRDTSVVSGH
ncbi:hypothetical protein TD95_003484 [Thielaviopsis punctulata]|uniref:Vacuolar membrane protein n=1 Tax=Thielaviopsis punctulata TaxID=72032 RepID=A0A0F4ZGB6_9PEZI|nr:hypothetical protein TD95_003484 [Thielaviopsis punctulata]